MPSVPLYVNAWLELDEDQPDSVGYENPDSAFQRLITGGVYRAVDTLLIGFLDTVPTSASTVPSGDGNSYTLANGPASHPDGLTNADYMRFVVRDARATNPGIRILATLAWGDDDVISRIFKGATGQAGQRAAESFARNLVLFLRHWNLDGLDVDWESPLSDGTSVEQFKLFFDAVGVAFRGASPPLYLTLSPATADNLDASAVNDNVAFVNLQLYSGFTSRSAFTRAGIKEELLAYGAKFESDTGGVSPTHPGHQSASNSYQEALKGGYTVITQWRLNSGNFIYEQDQQQELHKLVHHAAEGE